jgi:hypothetical protein
MLLAIDLHPRFISADNAAAQNTFPNQLIGISTFCCQPVQQAVQPALADARPHEVVQQLLKPSERQVLPDIEVSNEGFDVPAVAYRAVYPSRKFALNNLSTCTLAPVNPVFGHNLSECRNVDNLSFAKKIKGLVVQIFTALRAKACAVLDNLVWGFGHFQRFPFVPRLTTHFTVAFLPKAAGAKRPVFILGGRYRTIAAVLSGLVFFQLLLQLVNFCLQPNNDHRLCLHKMSKFFHCYLIGHLLELYSKTIPEIHYIKELNRLFINVHERFLLVTAVFSFRRTETSYTPLIEHRKLLIT